MNPIMTRTTIANFMSLISGELNTRYAEEQHIYTLVFKFDSYLYELECEDVPSI